jgi:hypothetical protein
MANLVVAIFAVAIILGAMAGISSGLLGPQDQLAGSLKQLGARTGDVERTGMTFLNIDVSNGGGSTSIIDIELRNDGQTSFRDWESWDLFITFEAGSSPLNVQRLTYTTAAGPAAGEWTIEGIYMSDLFAVAEEYEPGIVNTTETVRVRARVNPNVAGFSSNSFTLASPSGVSISAPFSN